MRQRLVAVALGCTALAGCSGHSSQPGPASLHTRASAQPTVNPSNSADRAVAYTRCMRRHGVHIPDPPPGSNDITMPTSGGARTRTALTACQHYLPSGKFDSTDPKVLDETVRLAHCLRAHGIDVADPTSVDPKLRVNPRQKSSRAFRHALQICETSAGR